LGKENLCCLDFEIIKKLRLFWVEINLGPFGINKKLRPFWIKKTKVVWNNKKINVVWVQN
jgi:hypothetical protein